MEQWNSKDEKEEDASIMTNTHLTPSLFGNFILLHYVNFSIYIFSEMSMNMIVIWENK